MHDYTVTAVYVDPDYETGHSNIVSSAHTPPSTFPPRNLTATGYAESVTLAWEEPLEGNPGTLLHYNLMKWGGPGFLETITVEGLSYIDNFASSTTNYGYQVSATYSYNSSTYTSVSPLYIHIHPESNPPRNLTVTQGEYYGLDITWEEPDLEYGETIMGYKLYKDGVQLDCYLPNGTLSYFDGAVDWGITYTYYVIAYFTFPTYDSRPSNTATRTVMQVSDKDIVNIPTVSALKGNYPNPFNPTTSISFDNAKAGNVTIDVFNTKGQKVRSLVNGFYSVGEHSVVWNGLDDKGVSVGSGIYFYRMRSGEVVSTKKMMLLK
jgi:hypothetical protein